MVVAQSEKTKAGKIKYDPTLPATVISFGSPKGGPGKSTLAVAIAGELGRRCEGPVTLVDLDRTANAYLHMSRAVGSAHQFPATAFHEASLAENSKTLMALAAKLQEHKGRSQYLILDTPGAIENPGAQFALSAADIVIMPMRPAPYDLQATMDGLQILHPLKARNPNQVHMVVINAPERTSIGRDVTTTMQEFCGEVGAVFAESDVRKSVAFTDSSAKGVPIWTLGRSASGACDDIVAFVDEILRTIRVK